MASLASSLRRLHGDRRWRRRRRRRSRGGVIPTMFHEPEEAPGPWQTLWLSSWDAIVHWRGGGCGDNGGGDVLALAACKNRQWTVRREREGGGGGCSDEAVAMLPRGGRAADKTMRGVGAEGAVQGELEADDSTRGGGRTTRGKRVADDRTTQHEGGGARRSRRRRQRRRR